MATTCGGGLACAPVSVGMAIPQDSTIGANKVVQRGGTALCTSLQTFGELHPYGLPRGSTRSSVPFNAKYSISLHDTPMSLRSRSGSAYKAARSLERLRRS